MPLTALTLQMLNKELGIRAKLLSSSREGLGSMLREEIASIRRKRNAEDPDIDVPIGWAFFNRPPPPPPPPPFFHIQGKFQLAGWLNVSAVPRPSPCRHVPAVIGSIRDRPCPSEVRQLNLASSQALSSAAVDVPPFQLAHCMTGFMSNCMTSCPCEMKQSFEAADGFRDDPFAVSCNRLQFLEMQMYTCMPVKYLNGLKHGAEG